VSANNPEAAFVVEQKIPCLSMPQAMAEFFLHDKIPIVIAGTHGKTTTTALMAHLLRTVDGDNSFFVGGVTKNNSANFHVGTGRYFVLEGDEYDTAFFDKGPKFLHYRAQHVILTSVEFDHADIYRDLDHVCSSFQKLLDLIPSQGSLHAFADDSAIREKLTLPQKAYVNTYGHQHGQWKVTQFHPEGHGTRFVIERPGQEPLSVASPLWGLHNALNTTACLSVMQHLGFDQAATLRALSLFKGVKRRQDILHADSNWVVIDDFAHHPTAVLKTIAAVRDQYPHHHLVAIFEPRSNSSRRNVFQNDYARAFGQANTVWLAPVNLPAKVEASQRLNVAQMAADITHNSPHVDAKACESTDMIFQHIKDWQKYPTVLLFMSNGGFDNLPRRTAEFCKSAS
jgi:UDP-N-acetylmuramate: L-alanyl-gamma-D-glutamyl-meso-diaminopimelate ligase